MKVSLIIALSSSRQISGGSPDLHKDYEEFKLGVPLFSGIKVVMTTGGGGGGRDGSDGNYLQGTVLSPLTRSIHLARLHTRLVGRKRVE